MQRIKLNVFKSWFDKNLTGKEIDFLLVLSFYQDKRGVTRGVYYKDMMREGKMSAQTFYDCKKSLTEKGYLHMAHLNGRVYGAKQPKCEAERSHHL